MKSDWVCVDRARSRRSITVVFICILAVFAGCTTYEPVPVPAPSTFDRSWSAAVSAAQDEGVRITSEDRGSGVIRGIRNEQEVTMNLRSQADGSVRIEISARGPKGSDPGFSQQDIARLRPAHGAIIMTNSRRQT
jgi:hypothetical protein